MSFLTAEKRTTLPVAPRGGGGKTYLGNARLKTFFHLAAFPYQHQCNHPITGTTPATLTMVPTPGPSSLATKTRPSIHIHNSRFVIQGLAIKWRQNPGITSGIPSLQTTLYISMIEHMFTSYCCQSSHKP